MNFSVVLFLFALVTLSTASTAVHPRGCIYALGKCITECDVGTHGYATGCGFKTPEPTCDQPNPVQEEGIICDFTACYCDAPTVRDLSTKKCVLPENCPMKE